MLNYKSKGGDKIKIEIEDGKIMKLIYKGVELELSEPRPISEIEKIEGIYKNYQSAKREMEKLFVIAEDTFVMDSVWKEKELRKFMSERSKKQRAFFETLVEMGPGFANSKKVFGRMGEKLGNPKFSGSNWTGSYGGMRNTIRNRLHKEDLTENIYKSEDLGIDYRIKVRYFLTIKKILEGK